MPPGRVYGREITKRPVMLLGYINEMLGSREGLYFSIGSQRHDPSQSFGYFINGYEAFCPSIGGNEFRKYS